MTKQPNWLVRIVECFDKETEQWVAAFELPQIELKMLQEMWNQPADEPMVDVFDVNAEQAAFLKKQEPNLKFDVAFAVTYQTSSTENQSR